MSQIDQRDKWLCSKHRDKFFTWVCFTGDGLWMNTGFPRGSKVKNPRALGDSGSIPESGRSPEAGPGDPLQYYCLEKPMDRGAWRSTVHRVAKSQTQLSIHECTHMLIYFALYSLPLFFSLLLNWIPELGSSVPTVFHSFTPCNPIRGS